MSRIYVLWLGLALLAGFAAGRATADSGQQAVTAPTRPGLIKEPMGVSPAVNVDGLTNAPWNTPPAAPPLNQAAFIQQLDNGLGH